MTSYLLTDAQTDALELAWKTSARRKKPWTWLLCAWAALTMGLAWWTMQHVWLHPELAMSCEEAKLLPPPFKWRLRQPFLLKISIGYLGFLWPGAMMLTENMRFAKHIQHVTDTAQKLQVAGTQREQLKARAEAMSTASRLVWWARYMWLVVLVAWVVKTFLGRHAAGSPINPLVVVAYAPSILAARYLLIWPRFYRADVTGPERWGTWIAIMILAAAQMAMVIALLNMF